MLMHKYVDVHSFRSIAQNKKDTTSFLVARFITINKILKNGRSKCGDKNAFRVYTWLIE